MYRDPVEPVSADDLAPLPEEVTQDNARRVVRQCLQAHRATASSPTLRLGYAFRDAGFVEIMRFTDLGRERVRRTYVDYAAVRDCRAEEHVDLSLLRTTATVTIVGNLGVWESVVTPYAASVGLGEERELRSAVSLALEFGPREAQYFCRALLILRAR